MQYLVIDGNGTQVMRTDSEELCHQVIEHSDALINAEFQLPYTVIDTKEEGNG